MAGQENYSSGEAQQISNDQFTSASALELRLRSDQLIDQIYNYLTGKVYVQETNENGDVMIVRKQIVDPKMNDKGANSTIAMLKLVINPSVVQGYWTRDYFNLKVYMIRRSLADSLMLNLNNYDIHEDYYEEIIDNIMILVAGFLSRLVDNKERESYANTLKTVENNTSKINEARL
jgi:hypothetical protein